MKNMNNLSAAQKKLVLFMRQHNVPVYTTRFTTSIYFPGALSRLWEESNKRAPSIATLTVLINKGILVRRNTEKTPYYRDDYYLTEQWETE